MPGCVGKVLKILTAISENGSKPITLKKIAEVTGIAKSTCARIVEEMMEEGFVNRVSRTEGYRLGPAAFSLSSHGRYDSEFVEVCHPVLRWLYTKTELCVGLATIQNDKVYIVDCLNTHPRTVTQYGRIYSEDIYFTPAGRIIMANMSEDELRKIYEKYGNPVQGIKGDWNEVTSFDTLKEQLAQIDPKSVLKFEERSVEEKQVRWGGWGAAIYQSGKCVGAVVISVTTANGTMEAALAKEEEIKSFMLKARNEIGRRLSY